MSEHAQQRAIEIEKGAYARRLGARVMAIGKGTAEVQTPYRNIHANSYGLVHGGVAASAALWAGSLAAWSSQRLEVTSDLQCRALSLHISYLAVARQETLRALAAVTERGREAVHVRADVLAGDDRLVAQAAMVYRIAPRAKLQAQPVMTRPGRRNAWEERGLHDSAPLPLVAPFIRSAGIQLCSTDRELALMKMPLAGNQNAAGTLDEGALVGCLDTCAALACKPFHDEMPTKSTTLTLSVAFGAALGGDVAVTSRLEARDDEIFTTTVEASSGDHSVPAASGVVVYRFA